MPKNIYRILKRFIKLYAIINDEERESLINSPKKFSYFIVKDSCSMNKQTSSKFWASLAVFGLIGQIAWVVENMYFNVFIYKMFHASAADISLMVAASAVMATVTTIFIGALSDHIGKRKLIICGGYTLWGLSILAFSFIRMDYLSPIAGSMAASAALGVNLVILMDCVMTFLGSSANDACFNAWLTDWGNDTNRGKIEGINAMMPLLAVLVVFGGFSAFDLDAADSWTVIYTVIGLSVTIIGLVGFAIIEDKPAVSPKDIKAQSYWTNIVYSFRLSVVKSNRLLYVIIGTMAVFNISIQVFMPYLILYYEKTLGMVNYVLIMAPAIIIAAVITAFYGKLFDMIGFKLSILPCVLMLMLGYVLLYFTTGLLPVFIGSLLMLTGNLSGGAVLGAMIRSNIPENKAGQFQGVRIIGQVLIPGVIGPAIGAAVLKNALQIINSDGTTSFLPNRNIYLAAFIIALLLLIVLYFVFRMMRNGHNTLYSRCGEELLQQLKTSNEQTIQVWQEYPRPQLKREEWMSLNGSWSLNGRFILVPFPPQSSLSGYDKPVENRLVYEKTFILPESYYEKRILLHFGAVDQIAEVSLNGVQLGRHEGGYLPFTFDISGAVLHDGENRLTVIVTDKLSFKYPYGKQRKKRGGMWYTPVSGIWQTVWLEPVPEHFIQKLQLSADDSTVTIGLLNDLPLHTEPFNVTVFLHEGSSKSFSSDGTPITIELSLLCLEDGSQYVPLRWSPQQPYLYTISVATDNDKVTSYFALRKVEIQQLHGVPRVCLNGQPVFLNGVLDQGYFCDGIYLPASPQEYREDILRMKELGFNMLRKHIKIEPEIFYYYCDKLGMLVIQDMVNSGSYSWLRDTALATLGFTRNDTRPSRRDKVRRMFFEQHLKDTLQHLHDHPCIIAYTLFNEGWGQYDSDRIYQLARDADPSRLYDSTSGWFAQRESDFDSRHIYFKTPRLPAAGKMPLFISECGGYSCKIEQHVFSKYNHYGYGNCEDPQQLTQSIIRMYETMILPSVATGTCGCVYTQLSDVEDETNGLYTYDRKICKVLSEELCSMSQKLREALQDDRV